MTEEKNALHQSVPPGSTSEQKPSPIIPLPRDRSWAIACHASALLGFVIWMPAANVVGPLVLWLLKKNDLPLVAVEGKSALNFQLSMTLYFAIALMLMFTGVGFLLLAPLAIINGVCIVIATIKVYNAETFQYPISIKFIK